MKNRYYDKVARRLYPPKFRRAPSPLGQSTLGGAVRNRWVHAIITLFRLLRERV